MAETTKFHLPYPTPDMPDDVPTDMQLLAERLEAVLAAVGSIPGELKLWPDDQLPALVDYGHWDWADGGILAIATYPKAAANIANAWRTHGGKPDPGAGNFRKPDLRGLTPVGMDAMPGQAAGTRANRVARAAALVLAAVSGEEVHAVTQGEMPSHGHGVSDPSHVHAASTDAWRTDPAGFHNNVMNPVHELFSIATISISAAFTGIGIAANGGGGAHETMQPSVFVPWIVKLDD